MRSISPRDLQEWLAQSPPVVLDVREQWEVELAALPNSLHIPMGEIPQRLAELERDADIVVLCHHGVRSAHVAGFLEQVGFSRLYNLAGGIDAWAREVDPGTPRY
jgi:rhodanese-related sulfurtransferase